MLISLFILLLVFSRLRCQHTIEDRVVQLQEKKLKLAESILFGNGNGRNMHIGDIQALLNA